MTERALFRGHGLQAIDGKGRVAIPAPLRATIERNSGERILLLSRHESSPCLIGYDIGWSSLLHARIARAEERALEKGESFDRDNVTRRAFGLVEEVPFDASGRFILPPFFRAKGQLDDLAYFYATADAFEIWNPKILLETPGIDADMKDSAAYYLAARGAG